jgi:hypothetical protein
MAATSAKVSKARHRRVVVANVRDEFVAVEVAPVKFVDFVRSAGKRIGNFGRVGVQGGARERRTTFTCKKAAATPVVAAKRRYRACVFFGLRQPTLFATAAAATTASAGNPGDVIVVSAARFVRLGQKPFSDTIPVDELVRSQVRKGRHAEGYCRVPCQADLGGVLVERGDLFQVVLEDSLALVKGLWIALRLESF